MARKECQGENLTACLDCPRIARCEMLERVYNRRLELREHLPAPRDDQVHPANKLNELTGGQWLYFTKSLLVTTYPAACGHELRRRHGANKPPHLMQHLIEFFTKGGEKVLDPFAGVGGTLLGAALAQPPRDCLGIEINPAWVEIYHRVLQENPGLASYPLLTGDCLEVMAGLPDNSYHFIVTDPPYNTHLRRTMCNGRYDDRFANRRTDYDMRSHEPGDLANLASYEAYLAAMGKVLAACYRVLQPGRYMVIILRDAYQGGEYIFTHADIARQARRQGFIPKGDIIWYQAGTRLRPYGYPFAYVPNIVHQHILVLRKPGKSTAGNKKDAPDNQG
ncbi:MAG: hypothetical protein PWQ18_1511 [Clostridia bacterium]|nr:hypothetical protein [Clostridia bacterium]